MEQSVISKELLEILVCPVDKAELELLVKDMRLVCKACGRRYPIKDGIPIMLADEAEMPSAPGGKTS